MVDHHHLTRWSFRHSSNRSQNKNITPALCYSVYFHKLLLSLLACARSDYKQLWEHGCGPTATIMPRNHKVLPPIVFSKRKMMNLLMNVLKGSSLYKYRSQWPSGLRRRSAAARLLRSWVRIPPGAWMFVCCEYCVLSGRDLCDELITRPEESYRLCCVVVCDLETPRMRRPWHALGRSATEKKSHSINTILQIQKLFFISSVLESHAVIFIAYVPWIWMQ